MDVLAAPQYLVQAGAGADAVFVDINGVREIELLLPLLSLIQQLIRPPLLAVKSRHLVQSIQTFELAGAGPDVVGVADTRWWGRLW